MRNKIPDGILVKGNLSNGIYLLEDGCKRPVVNEDTFHFFKWKWERVVIIEDILLQLYPMGREVNSSTSFLIHSPGVLLVKGPSSKVYLWMYAQLYPIESWSVFTLLKLKVTDIVELSEEVLSSLPLGDTIGHDVFEVQEPINWLLYCDPDGNKYYCEKRRLRKIECPYVFEYLKWKEDKLIYLSTFEFSRCTLGSPIFY
ncbi:MULTISPECIES: hypothetical protein [unclassified Paenibacillus]|uniref:hypothetical protein n=1 Tax=unclassified Paenibacillus TaxID=185978 RepID=UPI0027874276|nr:MULTISPECIES: hypothetical protein [unclassified Paenibacillus]MDQ0901553.1 hypothetical protein [Paenibacillus sp. V4I7]MDQ0919944.1 hypothetical protein [Paenibacillus sp. V4I5]